MAQVRRPRMNPRGPARVQARTRAGCWKRSHGMPFPLQFRRLLSWKRAGRLGTGLAVAAQSGCVHSPPPQWRAWSVEEIARSQRQALTLEEAGIGSQEIPGGRRYSFPFRTQISPQTDPVRVPLRLDLKPARGLPQVRVRVNRRVQWWIVDTGSALTGMDGRSAAIHGVRPLKDGALSIAGTHADIAGGLALLPEITVGRVTASGNNLAAVAHGEFHIRRMGGLIDAHWPMQLLGMSYLRMFARVTLDYPRGVLELSARPVTTAARDALVLPMGLSRNVPYTVFKVKGKPLVCLVDTGSAGQLEIPEGFLQSVGVPALPTQTVRSMGVGGIGETRGVNLPRLQIEDRIFEDLNVETGGRFTQAGHGLVGSGFLKRFRVTFDFVGNRLILENPARQPTTRPPSNLSTAGPPKTTGPLGGASRDEPLVRAAARETD